MTRLSPVDKLCLLAIVLVALLPGGIIAAWDAPAGATHPSKPTPTGAVALTSYRWGHDNGTSDYAQAVLTRADTWKEVVE